MIVTRPFSTRHISPPLKPNMRITGPMKIMYLTRATELICRNWRTRCWPGCAPLHRGLDYGCGPAAALAEMLRQAGHTMQVYDPFFASCRSVLAQTYDFVTCTETAEHFHRPGVEFARLCGLLKPGGLLAVMTIFQTDDARFENWRYRHDPTHVVFYREHTFAVLAEKLALDCEIIARDVVFFTRRA